MPHKVLDVGAYRLKPQVQQRIMRESLRKGRADAAHQENTETSAQAHSVPLLFGKGKIDLQLPPDLDVTVIRKPPMHGLPDPAAEVERAVGPLEGLAQNARSACILICDITRPVPNGVLLPPIIQCLRRAGVSDVTILVATGLHRPNLGPELATLLTQGGESDLSEALSWLEGVRVENHYARNDEEHVSVGVTSQGNVVKLDRRFVEADLKIVTGLVEPHFMVHI